MRTMIAMVLLLLLMPAISFGDYHGYRQGPPPSSYGPRVDYSSGHRHHDDGWIVPLAIVGGVLGVMALSQMATQPPPPPPPQRICRDTYNYYDQYGQYLYSRYVDRPCF